MSAGSLEGALRLQKFILFAVIALAVVIFGYTLADDMFFAALAFEINPNTKVIANNDEMIFFIIFPL